MFGTHTHFCVLVLVALLSQLQPATAQPLPCQSAKLLAAEGAQGDQFGNSVAIWDDTIVIGAYETGYDPLWYGAAYVFQFDGASWVQQARWLPDDPVE